MIIKDGTGGADTLNASDPTPRPTWGRRPPAPTTSTVAAATTPSSSAPPTSSDFISGGSGIDAVDYSGRTNNLTLTIGATGNGEAGENDNISDVDNVYGGGGHDTIVGDGLANYLKGNGGNDTIIGGLGVDTIEAGNGNDRIRAEDGLVDVIDGGAGTDNSLIKSGSDLDVDRTSEGDSAMHLVTTMEN